jgi:hypothetical protein
MNRSLRWQFWVEAVLASITGFLTLLTLVTREWIEILFGVDPDGGSGTLEWALVAGLLVVTIVFSVLARGEWRRAAPAGSEA